MGRPNLWGSRIGQTLQGEDQAATASGNSKNRKAGIVAVLELHQCIPGDMFQEVILIKRRPGIVKINEGQVQQTGRVGPRKIVVVPLIDG